MKKKFMLLQGASSVSPFRLKQLNKETVGLKTEILSIDDIYIVSHKALNAADEAKLKQLLCAKSLNDFIPNHTLFVAPRAGTISSWSSKATDILKNCGFASIKRIEHARMLKFTNQVNQQTLLNTTIYDRMMEEVFQELIAFENILKDHSPQVEERINITKNPQALDVIDKQLGLALTQAEKDYVVSGYQAINKEPTQAELMMFAQANSEHCRHKIFNAQWQIDGIEQPKSLFSMIRNTEASTPKPAISAYKDNSAVFTGGDSVRWLIGKRGKYFQKDQIADILIKVETHNHPTAISPFPGAATGSGGEIRDEAATGQGSRPKAGFTGFSVSHLRIPNHACLWEEGAIGKSDRIASAFDIMLQAPLGAAAFNNEFGRPSICGYFRNLEINTDDYGWRGYHKPIMLAGGLGTINHELAIKQDTQIDDFLVVLGGPAMLIGLGGGAASSMTSGSSSEDLDFASVQRGNPEMERRCQEVIDSCWTQSNNSPIRSIHDVGAGGLSNAMPELLDDAGLGGVLELREFQIDTKSMSPMEIWCNESQERYVLSIKPEKLKEFKNICKRERCPYAVLGRATSQQDIVVEDSYFGDKPVNMPMDLLFGNTPKTYKNINRKKPQLKPLDLKSIDLADAVDQVLNFPTVASKKYLITIGDRTVSGLVHRDQMVGPWQVPVADCGVTLRDYHSICGEAMSIGEKAPLALIDGAASARMAVGEALTNIAGNVIGELSQIKLSANWMAASGLGREDEVLFNAVYAIGEDLCPQLGIGIPVGKDSLSMNSQWQDDGIDKQVTSPVSAIISAFANVKDVTKSLTPYFDRKIPHSFYLFDLGAGENRLGASSLVQTYGQLGDDCPNLDNVEHMLQFWKIVQTLTNQKVLSAYHDISDGGLFTTILEMCIASQCGADIVLDFSDNAPLNILFSEELGAIVAIEQSKIERFEEQVSAYKFSQHIHEIGTSSLKKTLSFTQNDKTLYANQLNNLEKKWSYTSYLMASHRDNPQTSLQEYEMIGENNNGLKIQTDFDFSETTIAPYLNLTKPKVAILREQGVNGQKEMAMAFYKAGFDCYDVHMQDLLDDRFKLQDFQGMAACGGFSYGDVLGAGRGWANSILFHERLKQQFLTFFNDDNKFVMGVCNGCQMLSHLKDIIPGAQAWPQFLKNKSEQFEARFSSLRIEKSQSIFFQGMEGAIIPVAIAHGEGQAVFSTDIGQIAAKYVDNKGRATELYPLNPNGSQFSTAAVVNDKGNIMAMMPHPERVFRNIQMSWSQEHKQDNSPWMRMFYNARLFLK